MRDILVRFALWLLRKLKYDPLQPALETVYVNDYAYLKPFIEVVKPFCNEQNDRWPDRSGEAKKHAVYAHAIKLLPDVPKRDVSLAIELALRK